ncbi:MAG: winged helix-turn-helix transcriptional regulator [Candidatus Thermoplasmatota archaeon]|nr:winged helix-turn-helix transcriptional regulator [Candidatus Thermoplasmatota archaeon]
MEEREKALELENRRKIYTYLSKFPGCYFTELQKGVGLETGVLQYHLNYLEKKELVTVRKEAYYKRYFAAGKVMPKDKELISLLRQKILRKIAILLILNPKSSYKRIASQFNISSSTFSYHLKKLVDSNTVKVEKKEEKLFTQLKMRKMFLES